MTSMLRWVAVLAAAAGAAVPAAAMYKVVGPDGRVTYTDRPPATSQGRTVPLVAAPVGTVAGGDTLPAVLRTPVARYPVTLYTVPNCDPCNRARELLRARGVPHSERTATTQADADAWQRQLGSLQAPQMTVGTQRVAGLEPGAWNAYLDAAGYPRQSALPPSYRFAPAQPLVAASEGASQAPDAAAPNAPAGPAAVPVANPDPPAPGRFRF